METKVYTFDELSDEAKEKAIEKLSDINTDDEWWYDEGLIELSSKEMKDRHIKLSDKWYEIYANIKGEYPAYTGLFEWEKIYFDIDRNSFLQFVGLRVSDDDTFRKFLRIPKKLWGYCAYSFNCIPSRNGNTKLVIETQDNGDFTPKQQEIIDRAIEIFSDKVNEGLSNLRKNFEYLNSREAIIETIKSNDYEFTENGKLV
jgi:hypothetical protein